MEYRDILLGPDDSPGFPDLLTHKIGTGDAKPIKHNYYRRSIKEQEYMDGELEKMVALGDQYEWMEMLLGRCDAPVMS
jgi:hypothetical protein